MRFSLGTNGTVGVSCRKNHNAFSANQLMWNQREGDEQACVRNHSMSNRGVAPSNDAFAGGAQQRNLYPPGVGGAIGSANTSVSSPIAGVAPGQIKSALNNSTSNIGIPYSRLVPLNNSNKLVGQDENGKTVTRKETEDLRATSLAFILGIRGDNKPPRPILQGNEVVPGNPGYNVAFQPAIMPAMVGTERFQQLCSMEYLNEYFKQVLAGKTISLDQPYGEIAAEIQASQTRSTGPVGVYNAAANEAAEAGLGPNDPGMPSIDDAATMLKMPDLAKQMGLRDSDASRANENYQGIFARDFGPFLKGKGSSTELLNCTVNNLPQLFNPDAPDDKKYTAQPFAVSRNFGDDLAFSLFDAKLMENGLTDWRPDGIVLSKGVNDPSDQLSNEYLEARDGQLCARAFRTRQGHDAYACSHGTAPLAQVQHSHPRPGHRHGVDGRAIARGAAARQGIRCHNCGCLVRRQIRHRVRRIGRPSEGNQQPGPPEQHDHRGPDRQGHHHHG